MGPSVEHANALLEPDRAQLSTFINALFKHADADTWASLRVFHEGDNSKPPFEIMGVPIKGDRLDNLVGNAVNVARRAAQANGQLVFSPPVATFANEYQAREVDLAQGLALSVECDQRPAQSRQVLENVLGPATIVMQSGGIWTDPQTGERTDKLHLHWRLAVPTREPVEHALLKRARGVATLLVGADPSAVPAVHPLRWAGSWHRKSSPRLATIIAGNIDVEIDLAESLSRLEAAAKAAGLDTQNVGASKSNADPDLIAVDWEWITSFSAYDELPADLRRRFEDLLNNDSYLAMVWAGKKPPVKKDGSASDISFSGHAISIAGSVKGARFSVDEFGALLWTWDTMQTSKAEGLTARDIQRDWARCKGETKASPEVELTPHDIFADAMRWTEKDIRANLGALRALQKEDRKRYDDLATTWDLLWSIDLNSELEQTPAKRPMIVYRPANLPAICDAVEAAFVADCKNERVMSYAGGYVSVTVARPTTVRAVSGKSYPSMPVIRHYDAAGLRERAMKSVVFKDANPDPKKQKEIAAPLDMINMLMSRSGGRVVPPLVGIIEAPTVHRGRIIATTGYDGATGLFGAFNAAKFLPVVDAPSHQEAKEALRYIAQEVFADFPFAEEVDRFAAVAALLTALTRRVLTDCPGFLLSAPMQASGKTALAGVIC